MLVRPKLKSSFHLETVESVGAFLVAEQKYYFLNGSAYEHIAPLIDGSRTTDEIVDCCLEKQLSLTDAYYVLYLMEQNGYLIENDSNENELLPEIAAMADELNVDRSVAARRLRSTTVSAKALGNVSSEALISKLESFNIKVGDEGDLEVVLTDDYLRQDLEAINRQAEAEKRPWMLVKPTGTTIWIGPIFEPEKTGCWECLAQRLQANRPVETFIKNKKGGSGPLSPGVSICPDRSHPGLDLAVTEIVKWIIQQKNDLLSGTLVTLDLMALQTERHIVVKRPQCEVCGDTEYLNLTRSPAPIVLQSRKKTFIEDGAHRSYSPEETLKKYQYHVSPLTGAVRQLTQISEPSNGVINVYTSGHNLGNTSDDLYFLRQGCRSNSAGKGKTDAQAKASALCEALERYSGLFQGYEIRYKSTYKDMGEAALHPNACMNFSEAQYQNRLQWNASYNSHFNKVPEPFDEAREIEWTPVWSLSQRVWKFLPTAFCYYRYPGYPSSACPPDSNGNAAGNTKEEAIIQGFMELAERDSVALWWYNRLQRPGVDLASFDDPYCQDIQDFYKTLHREIWVLDLTNDFGIPVFAAFSRRIDKPVEDITLGFGAHFDAKLALMRALTEMNQMLHSVSKVAPDGSVKYASWDEAVVDWWKTATLENQPYLVPDPNVPAKVFSDYAPLNTSDLKEDVELCVNLVKEKGMEMLVLDQTRPDIGLSVVKVIVPGMRHFWKRLAPGRLYDVPVQLGWLSEPLKEEELNPIPVFF